MITFFVASSKIEKYQILQNAENKELIYRFRKLCDHFYIEKELFSY